MVFGLASLMFAGFSSSANAAEKDCFTISMECGDGGFNSVICGTFAEKMIEFSTLMEIHC